MVDVENASADSWTTMSISIDYRPIVTPNECRAANLKEALRMTADNQVENLLNERDRARTGHVPGDRPAAATRLAVGRMCVRPVTGPEFIKIPCAIARIPESH